MGISPTPPRRRAADQMQLLPLEAPWPGIVRSPSEISAPANAFADSLNFMLRAQRIITRPKLGLQTAPPDGYPIRGLSTFEDTLNNLHTLILTPKTAYSLTAGYTYNTLTGDLQALSFRPYALAGILRRIYFCNGGQKISYADGSDTVGDANACAGARFLGVLGGHLVAAYTTEPAPGTSGAQDFPYRVRWSASGDPDVWTGDFTAGFADLVEVQDDLTGLMVLGYYGYLLRSNGVTVMQPTGSGAAPFYFIQYSNAPRGIGTSYPYSVSVYGNLGAFVGNDDVYTFDGMSFTPIGRAVKTAIFADLYASTDHVIGQIIPGFGQGFVLLSYLLAIPGPNVIWMYNLEEGSWVRLRVPGESLTALNSVAVA